MSQPSDHSTFDLSEISPIDAYKLTSGLVVPRPIGWIGTLSSTGSPNLAPYSFFNLIGNDPPHLAYSPGGGRRDSLDNVREIPEFTVNIVTVETVEAMNATAASLPPDEDEFDHAGLTKVASRMIAPPRVAEATATMECRVSDIVHIGRPGGGNHLVIGEIVMIHVADRVLDGTRVDPVALGAVGRHAGSWYSHSTDLFTFERPD
ncbi:MAG: flavin reductase family protein [Actinomycetia bacterium]|nr:flavin reductase family protein [Actinomycetes bacterium]